MANVNRGSHELEFASASLVPMATNQVGVAARIVRDRQAPESGLAEQQRMPLVQAALPHKRMCDRDFQRFGQRRQLGRRARRRARRRRHRSPAARAVASAWTMVLAVAGSSVGRASVAGVF